MVSSDGRFVLFLCLSAVAGAATAEVPPARYEISFQLEAQVSSPRMDAELLAGGRLLMASRRSPEGGLSLTLERVLEAPWKLYHVDPLGPFGEETKLSAVITLGEASWEALAERRQTVAAFAADRHRSWTADGGRGSSKRLDGAFAFVVIGSPRGRFAVELELDGQLAGVENRLTDRWLNGPFDRFIGTWGPDGSQPGAPRGYWFWNEGEAEPFSYEPHTYHALAAALELLDLPLPDVEAPAEGATVVWSDAARRAAEVVGTLAPKAGGAFGATGELTLTARRRPRADGGTLLELAASDDDGMTARRQTVLLPDAAGVLADTLELRLARDGSVLELAIGYRPVATDAVDRPDLVAGDAAQVEERDRPPVGRHDFEMAGFPAVKGRARELGRRRREPQDNGTAQ